MATSVYFSGAVKSEQDLYEDLVTESIKIFGQDVVYLPREEIAEDEVTTSAGPPLYPLLSRATSVFL